MGPPSFNGGRVSGQEKTILRICASMGPPSFNGGRRNRENKCAQRRSGFNRASVFQRRKGEPTLHPDFVWILKHFREHGIVPNFTTNNLQWLRNPKLCREIMNLAGAIGFSADDPERIREFRTLLDYNGFQDAKVNIHVVLGVVSDYSLYGLFTAASACHFDVTLLKYKNVGRGKNFKPKNYNRWLRCVSDFIKAKGCYLRIGIDTPLAEEYKEELQKAEIPDYMYETKEGKFSCYIDAVEKKIGPSSYCEHEKMIKLDKGERTESLALQIYNAFKQF
jgi:hypothetical protein